MRTSLRLARAGRLLKVQEQMRGMAERDLAVTQRRAAQVEVDRKLLLDTLAGETMQGLFLEAAARRLRAMASEATELGATAARQAQVVRERGLGEKRAERQVDALARTRDREREQHALLEQLDAMAARGFAGDGRINSDD